MVECGGLENRFTGNPGDEGSNPSSSASFSWPEWSLSGRGFEPCEGETAQWAVSGRAERGPREFAEGEGASNPSSSAIWFS